MAQMEFVPRTITLSKAPTGFEDDLASLEQKRAIANQLYSNAFNPKNTGIGGVLEQLGNALFAKLESNDVRKDTGALSERIKTAHDAKIAEIAQALKSGDPNSVTDVYTKYGDDEQVKDFIKPVVDAFGKRLENQQTFGDPTRMLDSTGKPVTTVANKAGEVKPLGGGYQALPDVSNVNGIAMALKETQPGTILPADPTDTTIRQGSEYGKFVPNQPAIAAKLASTPPLFGGAVDPNSGNFIRYDKHTGQVDIPEMGVPAGGSSAPINQIAMAVPQIFGPNVRATDTVRTPAQQEELRRTGATTAGPNGPHVRGVGLDLSANAGNSKEEIKAKFEAAGHKVVQVIDERAPGKGTGPHWHVEFDQSAIRPTVKEAQQAPAQNDTSRTLAEIRDKYDQLKALDAIPTEAQGGMINDLHRLGAKLNLSSVSGSQAQSLRTQIKAFRRPLAQNIAKASGMSSKQMDSNIELQSWLDSLSDPSQSYEANMEILKHVDENYGTPARARASMLRLGITPTGSAAIPKATPRSREDILKQYGVK